jgi:membrane dipeptidase
VDLIGADHVGLGLDYVFDSRELVEFVRLDPSLFPPDLNVEAGMPMVQPEAIAEIADSFARDNLTDAQIRGILGCNWLRIATQVWK